MTVFYRSLVNVAFKEALFEGTIREDHFPATMLDAVTPLTNVAGLVSPVHFTDAMTLILAILSSVSVPAGPLENAISMLFVIFVITFIGVNVCDPRATLPASLPLFQPIDEVTHILRPILPSVLPAAMSFPFSEFTLICISARENICTIAMLKALPPLALISVPILPDLDPVALCLAVAPLSNVAVSIACSPHAMPMFEAHVPLAIVDFPMGPLVHSLAMCLSLLEGAKV